MWQQIFRTRWFGGMEMKKESQVALLLVAGLMLTILMFTPIQVDAQGQNLLTNPGFEEGHYNQDGIAEITVPNGWRMHWSNRESKIFDGYAETARPETVVWNISGAPANEKDLYWKDGIYTVKIFKGWAPVWAAKFPLLITVTAVYVWVQAPWEQPGVTKPILITVVGGRPIM
jgi:hypothetical protein